MISQFFFWDFHWPHQQVIVVKCHNTYSKSQLHHHHPITITMMVHHYHYHDINADRWDPKMLPQYVNCDVINSQTSGDQSLSVVDDDDDDEGLDYEDDN